jgi:hypothetical protein
MTSDRSLNGRCGTLVMAGLLEFVAAAPALAATFDAPPSPRDLLLYGSLGLLAVALALRVIRGRQHDQPPPQAPDLRWWKNVESSAGR